MTFCFSLFYVFTIDKHTKEHLDTETIVTVTRGFLTVYKC